jgi:hypothetical protein
VITRGQRRFLIRSVDQEMDYLRGEVEFFDDDDFTPVPELLRLMVMEAARKLGSGDVNATSFQLVRLIEDVDFQNMMQRSRSELERFQKLAEVIDRYIERKDYAARMKMKAPTNGAGHKPAGI